MKARAYLLLIACATFWLDGQLLGADSKRASQQDFSITFMPHVWRTVLARLQANQRPPVTPLFYQMSRRNGGCLPNTPNTIAAPEIPSTNDLAAFFKSISPCTPCPMTVAHSAPTSPRSGVQPPGGSDGAPRRLRSNSLSLPPRHPFSQLTWRDEEADSSVAASPGTPVLQTPPSNRQERLARARARKQAALAARREREQEARIRKVQEGKNIARERTEMQQAEWESRESERQQAEYERMQVQKDKLQSQLAQPTAHATIHYRRKEGGAIEHMVLPLWRMISENDGIDLAHSVCYCTRVPTGHFVVVEYDARKNAYYLPDYLPTQKIGQEKLSEQLGCSESVEVQSLPTTVERAKPAQAFAGGVLSSAGGTALLYALTQYVQAFKSHRRFRQVGKRMQQQHSTQNDNVLSPEQMKALARSFYVDTQKMKSTRNKQLLRALLVTMLGSGALIGGIKMARATTPAKPLGITDYSWHDRHEDCPGYS